MNTTPKDPGATSEAEPRRESRVRSRIVDLGVALLLCVAQVVALLRTVKDLGYTRDEGFYFHASSVYARWFELFLHDRKAAFEPKAIDGLWSANHEHPGLIKSLFALSSTYLQHRHSLFSMEGTSYRFPAMVLSGILIAIVYLWGREIYGRLPAFVAAVLLAAMPRVFFQSHLACFDVPIMTMWTLTAYAYWKSLRFGGVFWPLATGVAFGLALDTKHNSWFLPFGFVAHFAFIQIWALLCSLRIGRDLPRPPAVGATRFRAIFALASMATVGPLVFYALWPWIWHDTFHRLQEYARFHLNHEYYNMEFLGTTYFAPPFPRTYAWLMTLATVPTVTLALFVLGGMTRGAVWLGPVVRRLVPSLERRSPGAKDTEVAPPVDGQATDVLWLVGLLINYAAWLSPNTPIFGGTKHWMTAYPFLVLFAGVGFDRILRLARAELTRRKVPAWLGPSAIVPALALALCVLVAPVVETAHMYLWGLSAYTPLVGGPAGAASLGLNRTFWGYTTGAVASFLNRRAPRNASVYIHDTAGPSWDMLIKDGRLRPDVRGAWNTAGSDYGLYHHEQHMEGQEYQNWLAYGTVRPIHIGGIDGVPVIVVYEQPRITRSQKP